MSRNPYLAASRPVSSFTRSSRTSKRNDIGSSKGSLLSRSRSSTAIGSGLSSINPYSSVSSYTPSSSSWQRPSSSSRLTRSDKDQSVYGAAADDLECERSFKSPVHTNSSYSSDRAFINRERSTSSRDLDCYNDKSECSDIPKVPDESHLKNYQQSKLDHPEPRRTSSSLQSLDSQDQSSDNRQSTTSLDSSRIEPSSSNDSMGITSSSVPKHLRQGHLAKSHSLDISQQPAEKTTLLGSMSVDRLLSRSESMSERDLRKLFKELAMENERLRLELKNTDDKEKQRQQDWIRKERQMQRKISELEEESKQAEQWKQEIQRLKDENRSLIRVVTKLSKKN